MDAPKFDQDGQPLNWALNRGFRQDRNHDELIGIIRGVIADGKVCEQEANLLGRWCLEYGVDCSDWPAGRIVERLNRIYEDGVATAEELDDFKDLLVEIVGAAKNPISASTDLPLTAPPPEIVFPDNVFVFTGKFAIGTRNHCFKETMLRGGICEETVSLRLDYLVIGSIGSRDWAHSAWGRKIERVVELQRTRPIAIVSEEHWARFLR